MLTWFDHIGILVVAGILFLPVFYYVLWRKKRHLSYLALFTIFWIYLLFVIGVTLLPKPHEIIGFQRLSPDRILSRVRLIPYVFIPNFHPHLPDWIDLFGNILLIIPFGFLFPLVAKISSRKFLWIAFLPGLTIELSQLAISLIIGFSYRKVDMTDVLTNTIGAFIGYGIFLLLSPKLKGVTHPVEARTEEA